MKIAGTLVRLGILVLAVLLLGLVSDEANWGDGAEGGVDDSRFAETMLIEWGFAVLVLGLLLALAMIGAAYLVRDERLENLLWHGGDEK